MEDNQSVFELEVDHSASQSLSTASGWAKFMAIFVLSALGLMLILFFSLNQQIMQALAEYIPGADETFSFGALAAIVGVVAVLCIVLMVFLLKAAILIRRGIRARNQQVFNAGLASLKSYFTMYGVLSVITLLLNIISSFGK